MHQETGPSLPRQKCINKGPTRKKSTNTHDAQRDCIPESVKQSNAVSRMIVSGIQDRGGSATPAAAVNTGELAERAATSNCFLRPKRQEFRGLIQSGDLSKRDSGSWKLLLLSWRGWYLGEGMPSKFTAGPCDTRSRTSDPGLEIPS